MYIIYYTIIHIFKEFFKMAKGKFISTSKSQEENELNSNNDNNDGSQPSNTEQTNDNEGRKRSESKAELNLETAKSAFSLFQNEKTGHYFIVEVKYDPATCQALVTSVKDVGLDKQDVIHEFKIKASELM